MVISYRPGTKDARGIYLWKQGGNVLGNWRVLQNIGEQQHTLFDRALTEDRAVTFKTVGGAAR